MRVFAGMLAVVMVIAIAHALGGVPRLGPPPDLKPDYAAALAAYEAQDWTTAHQRLRELARSGHAGAESLLGTLYYNGRGCEKDKAAAVLWFYRAARRGHGAAQLALGSLYLSGEGVDADPVQALGWITLARARGDQTVVKRAEQLIEQLSKTLSEQEQRRAHQWAQDWRPAYSFLPAIGSMAGT